MRPVYYIVILVYPGKPSFINQKYTVQYIYIYNCKTDLIITFGQTGKQSGSQQSFEGKNDKVMSVNVEPWISFTIITV